MIYSPKFVPYKYEDDKLLQKKANKDVLEPLSTRIERVQAFLRFFRPELTSHVVPIDDVYGPTAVDPNIQALVVSKETVSGASASKLLDLTTCQASYTKSSRISRQASGREELTPTGLLCYRCDLGF